ncbi:MAG: uracil-DNA glycosylase family protein [Rhodospirillaceae bacterium]|jgi:uracil-DNA glycosylase|nr:uracil-DNA glycosylase family protein [Rhodospirillaceae bacterium]MBT4687453.1 uracil-DNA glycosylase family protein [Rhodospirillaceae bacterium]MBT5080155.1 uracil-DNA glycosylase family protein [Rhodospirillaceae bacterium]MBT5527146.1 uracil-DNA glycosylase family protein [Rhodospirillaceae bacterium]MBT5882042.1 uracil-DNA glycosylase family protein [Rhodospirillaceae bacterium]
MTKSPALEPLLSEISRCQLCAADLPLGPRPVLRAGAAARLLIIGQAPGTKVHASGIPWDDPSGDRLRDWLQIGADVFYDQNKVAIMPMGFCYPGRLPKGGDRPPRPECAPAWHADLLRHLPNIELCVLAGAYAQAYYLPDRRAGGRAGPGKGTVTETVRAWRDHGPRFLPLPHPSWRTKSWQKRNPWFDEEVLPALRQRVREIL